VLEGSVKEEVEECVKTFTAVQKCELIELNVQVDHVHMLVFIPPKISISTFTNKKGQSKIKITG